MFPLGSALSIPPSLSLHPSIPPLSLSGKPESYAEYFSLNRTTAELLLLKPIHRELHSRFDLIIKVRNSSVGTHWESHLNECEIVKRLFSPDRVGRSIRCRPGIQNSSQKKSTFGGRNGRDSAAWITIRERECNTGKGLKKATRQCLSQKDGATLANTCIMGCSRKTWPLQLWSQDQS